MSRRDPCAPVIDASRRGVIEANRRGAAAATAAHNARDKRDVYHRVRDIRAEVDERRRSVLALRGISDIDPGMGDRSTGDLVADLATAVGLSARCRWSELFCRIAELIERESVTEADMAATRLIAEAARDGDAEGNHIRADGILCDVLEGLGYVETVRAFEEMEKWYE